MITAIKLLCNASLYILTTISFVEYVVQSRGTSDHAKSIIKIQAQHFRETGIGKIFLFRYEILKRYL